MVTNNPDVEFTDMNFKSVIIIVLNYIKKYMPIKNEQIGKCLFVQSAAIYSMPSMKKYSSYLHRVYSRIESLIGCNVTLAVPFVL